jgi:hypothetical protein
VLLEGSQSVLEKWMRLVPVQLESRNRCTQMKDAAAERLGSSGTLLCPVWTQEVRLKWELVKATWCQSKKAELMGTVENRHFPSLISSCFIWSYCSLTAPCYIPWKTASWGKIPSLILVAAASALSTDTHTSTFRYSKAHIKVFNPAFMSSFHLQSQISFLTLSPFCASHQLTFPIIKSLCKFFRPLKEAFQVT